MALAGGAGDWGVWSASGSGWDVHGNGDLSAGGVRVAVALDCSAGDVSDGVPRCECGMALAAFGWTVGMGFGVPGSDWVDGSVLPCDDWIECLGLAAAARGGAEP